MNRLRELRAGRYTQAEMAKLLGVGRTTYTKYENGDIQMGEAVLNRLSGIFGVSIDYLLGGGGLPADPEEELWAYREALRRDPERRMLFSLAKDASIEEVRQAVAIIDALKKTAGRAGAEDGDDPA